MLAHKKLGLIVIVSSSLFFLRLIAILNTQQTGRLFGFYIFMLMFVETRHTVFDHRYNIKV